MNEGDLQQTFKSITEGYHNRYLERRLSEEMFREPRWLKTVVPFPPLPWYRRGFRRCARAWRSLWYTACPDCDARIRRFW